MKLPLRNPYVSVYLILTAYALGIPACVSRQFEPMLSKCTQVPRTVPQAVAPQAVPELRISFTGMPIEMLAFTRQELEVFDAHGGANPLISNHVTRNACKGIPTQSIRLSVILSASNTKFSPFIE